MRTFDDTHGNPWQAALLEASYGNLMLLFTPMHGHDTRQRMMLAEDMAEAQTQLAKLDDKALRAMLAEAQSWDPGAGGS
ncbi:MAG: hypothetical protein ABI081_06300 [Burkholderiaceae bacterium]